MSEFTHLHVASAFSSHFGVTRPELMVEAARVQRGIGAGVLEVEMWRLVASCNEEKQQFELVHSFVGEKNVWRLNRVFN